MRMKILLILFVIILIFNSIILKADLRTKVSEKLYITNPKNIELVCAIINLTDYWDKRHTDFPFTKKVREKLLQFKNHSAVKATDNLIKKGWWQIYFFNIAMSITELPESEPVIKSKWFEREQVKNYINLMVKFYKDSDFNKLWKKNKPFYIKLQSSLAKRYKKQNVNITKIMEEFYGFGFDEYNIVPAVQLVDMGLHVEVKTEDKKKTYYFNGPLGKGKSNKEGDYFAPINSLIYNAFHEFGHSFLEPLLMDNQDLLKKYLYIYDIVKKGMVQKGYQSWDRVFIENLIHAVQICLVNKVWDEETTEKILEKEFKSGYFLIKDIYKILQDYENNREKYKNFKEFMPMIFEELGSKYNKKE